MTMHFIKQHKNPFIVLVILAFAAAVYAADTKLTDLSQLAQADNDDVIYIVDDANGTPASYKIPREEFLNSWIGSAAITTLGTITTGTINHEAGGLEADVSGYSGLVAISGGATSEVDDKSELEAQLTDVADLAEADGDVYTGDHDFGGADLELPQGQTPDTDGDIDLDFTDGSVVIQHGSAHAELASSTDVVVGKLIHSFAATLAMPDSLQSESDNWPLKAIESTEFPHGIVVTDIYLKVSDMSGYDLNVENWDDPNTINAGDGTIDNITTTAHSTDESTEDTITYSTIGAGQVIMLDLPTTDVSWIYVQVEYYEPIA
jgi:hypothetical protein